MVCGVCVTPAPDGARFCAQCGAALEAAPPGVETRKTVTAVFCDVIGSTALGDARDPEALRSVMTQYFAAMCAVLERHGGTVEKFIGDAVMAVFGVPVVHEDDALRAVRAAVEMQAEIERLDDELEQTRGVRLAIRVGVNTGEVVVGEGMSGTVATGDPINVAARLEQAAGPGEVLVGAATYDLVRSAVQAVPVDDLLVKGKSEPLRAWRVTAASNAPRPVTADVPLVGRARETAALRQAIDNAVVDRTCQLVTVLGAPGVGKTRLVTELVADLDGARILRARCPAYGDTDGLWPLAEVVRSAAGLTGESDIATTHAAITTIADSEVADRLTPVVTAGSPPGPDEVQWAVRRLLESLALERPLVVLFDDIHWASTLLLDVIDHVGDWVVDRPVVLLCVARPELLDTRPTWGGGKVNATTTTLRPLDAAGSAKLATALLGDAAVPDHVRDQVLAAAGGMPLYVEQMVAMLAADPKAPLAVPPTIQALLAARLERLSAPERTVLGAASVIGHLFYRGGLAALVDVEELRQLLEGLARKDFLAPATSDLPGEDALAFRHVLLRDSAYATLSKATRAELHERFGRWLDDRADRDDAQRFVVHHLREAVRLRDDLGPRDATGAALAREVATRLTAAARDASELDVDLATQLMDDAADLLPPSVERVELLLSRSLLFLDGADVRSSHDAARRAAAEAAALRDERLERLTALRVQALQMWFGIETEGGREAARAELRRFEAEPDDTLGVMVAAEAYSSFLQMEARWDDMVEANRIMRAAAARCGEAAVVRGADNGIAGSVLRGSGDIPSSLATIAEISARTSSRRVRARLCEGRASLLSKAGDVTGTDAALAESDDLYAALGIERGAVSDAFGRADVAMLRGDAPAAIAFLRRGLDELSRTGESGLSSNLLATLATALVAVGDVKEARRSVARAREMTAETDVGGQLEWRLAAVEVELADGDPAVAVDLAAAAVTVADLSQTVDDHARTRLALGRALAAAGRPNEAEERLAAARALWVARGAYALVRQVDAAAAAAR